jgi:hypothetical protein
VLGWEFLRLGGKDKPAPTAEIERRRNALADAAEGLKSETLQ